MTDHNSSETRREGGENLNAESQFALDNPCSVREEPAATSTGSLGRVFVCLTLFLLVVGTFYPALQNDFTQFDDRDYVTRNVHVQRGLTWENVGWAFRTTTAANWHPLTWISHMLDCQLFGLAPWGHHLTSLLLHAVNTLLVFLVFERMTGALWRSFFVAAFFGVHPLHVESVAWVAERKDVLSTAFGLLTVWAYARYARKQSRVGVRKESTGWRVQTLDPRRSSLDYSMALVFFALGLMSKPMLVTVPCVLLLLDYWPLDRFKRSSLWRLALEKAPFFLMSAATSCVTFVAQKQGGTVSNALPFAVRLGNAVVSYCCYLGKLFWPTNLSVYYPYPAHRPVAIVASAGLVLLAISMLTVVLRRSHPHLLVGWFWFIGTLVPVIGLVQVGDQAMADRYTYLPSVGVYIVLAWTATELAGHWLRKLPSPAFLAAVLVVCCSALTRKQIGYWKDSETLFRHAIAVTEGNYVAYDSLGTALSAKGQMDKSVALFREALRIKPDFAEAHNNLGASLEKKGLLAEAINHFIDAIRLKPDLAEAWYNLGNAFAETRVLEEAIVAFQKAVTLKPEHVDARYNLANTLNQAGRLDDANTEYLRVLKIDPNYAEAHYNLGVVYGRQGRWDEAVEQFQEFVKQRPDSADGHITLATILDKEGRREEAITHYMRAIQLRPGDARAHFDLGVALTKQGRPSQAVAEFRQSLKLKPDYTEAQKHLEATLSLIPGADQTPAPPKP